MLEYNEALIEERDQGIAEIHRQIGEVNEMFQVGGRARRRARSCCAAAGLQAGAVCQLPPP